MQNIRNAHIQKDILTGMLMLIFLTASLQAHDYGSMYINAGTVETTGLSNASWHTVGSNAAAGDDFATGLLSNWSFASNELTCTNGGSYHIAFSLSFEGSLTTWSTGVSVDDADPTAIFTRSISNANKDLGTVSGSLDATLTAGQTISLKVQPTATSKDFKPIYAQVVAIEALEVGDTPLGSMHINNGSSALSVGTSFVPITGFSAGDILTGITFDGTNNELDVGTGNGGIYFVNYHVSFFGDGNSNPGEHIIGVVEDGVTNDPTSIKVGRKTVATDIGVMGGVGIMNLTAGKGIRLEVDTDGPNTSFTVKYANLILIKLSGTEAAPPYASMSISSTQTVTVSALDTWYKIGTFTQGNLSGWSFSSDVLNPTLGSLSAGIYYAKYSLSFKDLLNTGVYETIHFALFTGGTADIETKISRILKTSTDVGNVQGIGFLSITSVDSTVDLRLKNVTNDHNITINSAKVNLYRMTETAATDNSLPVDLMYFSATSDHGGVVLNWETASEVENLGFIIERRKQGAKQWQILDSYLSNSKLIGQGSTTSSSEYQFIDQDVSVGGIYEYQLSDVDYANRISRHKIVNVTVRQGDENLHPDKITLYKAYPNPFNPSTTIRYGLPENSNVSLVIYDVRGQVVQTLESEHQSAGWYDVVWNGQTADGKSISTGIYFARLVAGDYSQTIKMLFLK
ncbi:MAG: T9SS type A sorting domain-containing protein [FCB group bacterium]|nr:T9SS type A sorting domain-containing protein [FCB group bacterium]